MQPQPRPINVNKTNTDNSKINIDSNKINIDNISHTSYIFQCPSLLLCVNQNEDLCTALVVENYRCMEYINDQNDKLCKYAIEKCDIKDLLNLFNLIKSPSFNTFSEAINKLLNHYSKLPNNANNRKWKIKDINSLLLNNKLSKENLEKIYLKILDQCLPNEIVRLIKTIASPTKEIYFKAIFKCCDSHLELLIKNIKDVNLEIYMKCIEKYEYEKNENIDKNKIPKMVYLKSIVDSYNHNIIKILKHQKTPLTEMYIKIKNTINIEYLTKIIGKQKFDIYHNANKEINSNLNIANDVDLTVVIDSIFNPSENICLKIVKKNSLYFYFIDSKNRTENVRHEAIQNNGLLAIIFNS